MMAEAFDIVYKFPSDIFFKFGCKLINGAGKHKVFPYYQTQLIAKVKEFVVGIVAAAPYTDTVEVGQSGILQEPAALLGAEPSKKVFFRNVISAHGKVFYAIYHVGKRFSPLVFFYTHGHSPKADSPAPGIHYFSFIQQIKGYLVQGLVSQAVGPPEFRLRNQGRFRVVFQSKGSSVRGSYSYLITIEGPFFYAAQLLEGLLLFPLSGAVKRRRKMKSHFSVFVLLGYVYRVNPGFGNPQQGDAAENSCIREMSTPIPAVHIVGLANMAESFPGVFAASGGAFCEGLCGGFEGRVEHCLQSIPFRL